MPEACEGKPAPDFTLPAAGGREVSLSDFRGHPVVLYFYPKDNTPGCTRQARELRDHMHVLSERGAVVLGVSRDTVASHEKFADRHELPFLLLSDRDGKVSSMYGVIKEKNMFGNTALGVVRSTFVIDENGVIKKAMRKVKVDQHIDQVLEALG